MRSACCCTVSLTTSSTCFVCSYLCRCAPHKSKRCAFSYSRLARASAKQLVASAFTGPEGGPLRRSSKPSATPLSLSRPSTTHSRMGQAELSRKTLHQVKRAAAQTSLRVDDGPPSFPPSPIRFLRYDSRLS